jgi:hypothetical protein
MAETEELLTSVLEVGEPESNLGQDTDSSMFVVVLLLSHSR